MSVTPEPTSSDLPVLPVTTPPNVPTGSAAEGSAMVPRRVVVPPQPYDRLRMWIGLIVAVVVCLPAVLVNLKTADVSTNDEAMQLITSRETWQRWHDGQRKAWLIPSTNGEQAVADPPMTTWLQMLAWIDLDPPSTSAGQLAWRGRLVSAGMAMLALLATYWAGMSLGGPRVGLLSGLALGSTLLLIYQARIATSETVLLGWLTTAIAAGLWAMRPLKPINWVSRRVSGWIIAGLALAAAILTKGPEVLVFFLPPMLAAVMLTPQRRLGNALGLTFAVFLGILAATPWYLYILEHVPDAWSRLRGRFEPPEDLFVISWSHGRVLAMLSPWIIFIIAGLFQPFLRSTGDYRRQLLIGWFWFVLIFLALASPSARHPRFILPLLPAAALLVGQLFNYHIRLASERQLDPGVNLLRVPHWGLMIAASIVGPLFIAYQPELVQAGWIERVELPGLNWIAAGGLGVSLLLMATLGARWHFKWQPRLAAFATVAWMLTASTISFHSYAQSYHRRYEHKGDAMRIASIATRDKDLVHYMPSRMTRQLDEEFLYYVGRVVRHVQKDQLPSMAAGTKPTLVITDGGEREEMALTGLGYVRVMNFSDGTPRRLYLSPKK